jgi:hypothetical protein
MAWVYYPPGSRSPWKPRNSLQAAEDYLRQKLSRPAYGRSQRLRQVHLRPIAPQYYQQPAGSQYYQPHVQQSYSQYYQQPSSQYYQSAAPQYYQPVQPFYEHAMPQYYEQSMQQYYQSPAPQYFEQAALQYAPLGVSTENIQKLPQDLNSLFQ